MLGWLNVLLYFYIPDMGVCTVSFHVSTTPISTTVITQIVLGPCLEFLLRTSTIIPESWKGTGSWNNWSWKWRACYFFTFNAIAVDDLEKRRSQCISSHVIDWFSQKILVSAPGWLSYFIFHWQQWSMKAWWKCMNYQIFMKYFND